MKKKNNAGLLDQLHLSDPFEAVPIIAPGVEAKTDERGFTHLRRRLPSTSAFGRFLARKFGWHREALMNLDDKGSIFWNQIDGNRSLDMIERTVRRALASNEKDCRKAVIQYTRDLMLRGLINLKVQAKESKEIK